MNCQELAEGIESLQPGASIQEVARLCLLLSNESKDADEYTDPDYLVDTWKNISLKLQSATDQHTAMTEELEKLANSDPQNFTQDQIWILIRAIKVQSQILQMYIGESCLDV